MLNFVFLFCFLLLTISYEDASIHPSLLLWLPLFGQYSQVIRIPLDGEQAEIAVSKRDSNQPAWTVKLGETKVGLPGFEVSYDRNGKPLDIWLASDKTQISQGGILLGEGPPIKDPPPRPNFQGHRLKPTARHAINFRTISHAETKRHRNCGRHCQGALTEHVAQPRLLKEHSSLGGNGSGAERYQSQQHRHSSGAISALAPRYDRMHKPSRSSSPSRTRTTSQDRICGKETRLIKREKERTMSLQAKSHPSKPSRSMERLEVIISNRP